MVEQAKSEFGDFEEIKEFTKPEWQEQQEQEIPTRIRLPNPKRKELLGIVVQRLGGNRMEIKATDGKKRNCRVPGRFKRKFWLRPGDIVLISPWEHDDDKGDIIFQYKKSAFFQLKNRGFLKNLEEGF